MARISPPLLLGIYAVANIALCAVEASAPDWVALTALVTTSFSMSIMFPSIFGPGIAPLGAARPLGSSFIIMAIVGGAFYPPRMGLIAMHSGGIPSALLLPLVSFAIIAAYAFRLPRGNQA